MNLPVTEEADSDADEGAVPAPLGTRLNSWPMAAKAGALLIASCAVELIVVAVLLLLAVIGLR